MKKVFISILSAVFLLAILSGCQTAPTAEIVIFHTNDIHGRVIGDDENIIGIDRIAAIYKNTPHSILVDAGDTLHGLPVATLNRGMDIALLMKETGYSAMAVGNHEFNYGWERLAELRDIAGFPFLASNVSKDGSLFLDDTMIITVDKVKIGMFGIITEATAHSAMPEYVRDLTFADPVQTALEKAEYLRSQGVHIVVAICHLGNAPYSGTLSTVLAAEVPEIDVLIDGHSHTELPDGLMENGVLIAQTGQHGNYLGKITVSIEKGIITAKTAALISVEEARETVPDEEVEAMLSAIAADIVAIMNEPVGVSDIHMSSERSPGVRTEETPIGNLIADAFRAASDADIAIINGGAIRADILPGTITKGDVISVLPFGNTLMVKSITPALLYDALENGVSGIIVDGGGNVDYELSPQGRFPQISGFSFVYDPFAPEGERVMFISLNDGQGLRRNDNDTVITLVSLDYIMTGGDLYTMFSDLPVLRELGSADDALAEFIRKSSPVNAQLANRIVMLTESSGSMAA